MTRIHTSVDLREVRAYAIIKVHQLFVALGNDQDHRTPRDRASDDLADLVDRLEIHVAEATCMRLPRLTPFLLVDRLIAVEQLGVLAGSEERSERSFAEVM